MKEIRPPRPPQSAPSQLTIPQAYAQALNHYNGGRFREADALCTAILQAVPQHVDAVNLLGVIAQKLNRHDLALEQFQRAIGIKRDSAQLHYNLGISLYRMGQIEEAVQSLETALGLDPDNKNIRLYLEDLKKRACQSAEERIVEEKAEEALQQGVRHYQNSRLEEAVASYQKALELKPQSAAAHANLGLALQGLGKLDPAIDHYHKALAIQPDFTNALYNLGNALSEQEKWHEASVRYEKVLLIEPHHAQAHANLGNVLKEQGELDEAITHFRKAIFINPHFADAYYNLANTEKAQSKLDDALSNYQKVLAIVPDHAGAHYNLGTVFSEQGRVDRAVACYRQSLAIKPDDADAHHSLATALCRQGKYAEAIASYRGALSIQPDCARHWIGYAHCLNTLPKIEIRQEMAVDLLQMLDHPAIRPLDISHAVLNTLRGHPTMMALLEQYRSENIIERVDETVEKLASLPLLLRFMELSAIADLALEKLLTYLRRAILGNLLERGRVLENMAFPVAMALHCFTHEYVYPESEQEQKGIADLEKKVSQALEKGERPLEIQIALMGAYRPLYGYSWSARLLSHQWSKAIDKLLDRQIKEPAEERKLLGEIESIAPVENTVSQAVRRQYEENPYPRWVSTCISDSAKPVMQVMRRVGLSLESAILPFPDRPEILIAGCGTGQHALITASRFKDCRVLAVDLSRNSLAHALRKTRELGMHQIDYMQGDILTVNRLDRAFDMVESVGVLHHMEDPIAGWRSLVDILRPGGLMKIGLYSEMARKAVVEIRADLSVRGYADSADDIRRCRQEIIQGELASDSVLADVARWVDFYSLSECRDLLFHTQEHRFSLLQIEKILEDLGLQFLGFELPNREIRRKFSKRYPAAAALTELPLWHAFEKDNPQSFADMYQFWVQKRTPVRGEE